MNNTTLKLKAHEEEMDFVDWFFMLQEFEEEPEYENIEVHTENNIYNYKVIKQFDKWFVVTD